MADCRCTGRQIDDDGVVSRAWEGKGNGVRPHNGLDTARDMDAHWMRVGHGHTDQSEARYTLHIVSEPKDIAAANEGDRANSAFLGFLHGEVDRHQSDDMAGSAIAVDAGDSGSLMRHAWLGATIETISAQFATVE